MSKIRLIEDNLRIIRESKKSDETLDALIEISQLLIDNLSGRFDGARMSREWHLKNLKIVIHYGSK